jgi:hypothetical protein
MRCRGAGGRSPDGGTGGPGEPDFYRRTRRRLIHDWLVLAWHVDGMSYDRYLKLPISERIAIHGELKEMIDDANPEGGTPPTRPKRMRK